MQNWQKNRNFKKLKNADETFTYLITVDNQDVEVSEAVYTEYAKGGYKMEYMENHLKRNRTQQDPKSGRPVLDEYGQPIVLPEREVSLDKMLGEDWDFPLSEPATEDAVIEWIDFETLYRCLDSLDADERNLINALFFEELSIREYAEITGLSKSAVDRRRTKILGKLKEFLKKENF